MTRLMWFAASVIAAIILAALVELMSWYSDQMWAGRYPFSEEEVNMHLDQIRDEWEADHAGA